MNETERQTRGDEAKRLIESPVFQDAVKCLEQTYIEIWKNATTVEAREDAHRYVQLLKKFPVDLKSMMMDGQIVRTRIQELEGQSKKLWS